jgi:hypothetical protein
LAIIGIIIIVVVIISIHVFVFIVHLTMSQVAQNYTASNYQARICNELESIWKEEVVACFMVIRNACALPAGAEPSHVKPRSQWPVFQPKFELGTSLIQVRMVMA